MKFKFLNTIYAPLFLLSVIGTLLIMVLPTHAGESVISPLSIKDVSEFYVKHLDMVDDVNLLDTYTQIEKVEKDILVRTVLRGKVVFAGKSKRYGKVVVVKHANNVHTIYLYMSKIAPTVHVGVKILQGYVVGKTSAKFGFEVRKGDTMDVFEELKKLKEI